MLRYLTVGLGHLFRSRTSRGGKDEPHAANDKGDGGGSDGDGDEKSEAKSGEPEMGFFEHLDELRSMLLHCIAAFAISLVITFCFSPQIFEFMRRPLREALAKIPKPAAEATAAISEKPATDIPVATAEIVSRAWEDLDRAAKKAATTVEQAREKLDAAAVAQTPPPAEAPAAIVADARRQLDAAAKDAAATADAAREKLLHTVLEKNAALEKTAPAAEPKGHSAASAYAITAATASGSMLSLKFMDIFSVLLNIGLVCGIGLSSAFILYFVGKFVAPALTTEEKKYLVPFCAASLLLFIGGCTFSFVWLIPISIEVVYHFNEIFGMTFAWVAADYYNFVTMMVLIVGLTFQFPLIVVILQYLEIVQTKTLFRLWRHVLFGILVGSLVVSPLGDPVSLSVLTGVLFVLYIAAASVGGLLVRAKQRKRIREELEYELTYGKPHPRRAALDNAEDTDSDDSSTTSGSGESEYDYTTDYGTDGDERGDNYTSDSYDDSSEYSKGYTEGDTHSDDETTEGEEEAPSEGEPPSEPEAPSEVRSPESSTGEAENYELQNAELPKEGGASPEGETPAPPPPAPPSRKGDLQLVE